MQMKIKREIQIVLLAFMFITLACPGGFAETNVGETNAAETNAVETNVAEKNAAETNVAETNVAGTKVGDFQLSGYIEAGGGILFDSPRSMDRAYLQKYIPFPQGFLADTELSTDTQGRPGVL